MLWGRKGTGAQAPAARDDIAPAALPLAFDDALFKRHFAQLVATAGCDGGIEGYLEALGAKQRGYAETLAPARAGELTLAGIVGLLERAFTARRRIAPALRALGEATASRLVGDLLGAPGPLAQRMQRFVDAMPGATGTDRDSLGAAARLRRAAWDFAAELVHFSEPARFPLMTRWVWDRATQTGALREFIRGGDAMAEIPLTNDPGVFEAARHWLARGVAAEGIYRDVPLWIDLTLARAYTGYLRSVTEGSLGADFARGTSAHEQLRKLLGIDVRAGTRNARNAGAQHAHP